MNGNTVENGFTEVNNGYLPFDESFATRAIHVGQDPDKWSSGIVIPPIHMGTTFKQDAPAKHRGFEYGRSGNPSRAVLEECLASVEGSKYGLAFASGLAAASGLCALLKNGDHLISGDDIYGGMNRYLRNIATNMGLESSFVDPTVPENIENVIRPNTKMVWIESPTNPLMRVMDIPKLKEVIKRKNEEIIIVVDNTFLTPFFQKPLELGADIVMYSLTKYMNGHSDVIMGAATMNDPKLFERMAYIQNSMGIVPSPFDCYLVNRSLKTLAIRMKEHMKNAIIVANFLDKHPYVEKVIFPGLKSHPQYEVAKRLWSGVSGMMSIYIKGKIENANAFFSALKVFTLAESLGGFESLAELPCVMTHASVPEDQRIKLGITDNLIRLSIGLEAPKDLVNDLNQALKAAAAVV